MDLNSIKAKGRIPTTAEIQSKSWVRFRDMHSGGRTKRTPFERIYIQVPEGADPKTVFYNVTGRNPDRVTCTCCGPNYGYSDDPDTLDQESGNDRNCYLDEKADSYVEKKGRYGDLISLEDFVQQEDVLLIFADELPAGATTGEVSESGYVWVG
jgi:hypothetical protein